jgi:transcriptional regulator with XRE-family HTH domain
MRFGEKMREARLGCDLTQAEAARRLGLKQQALSKWESGYSIPRTVDFFLMCRTYGVRPEYFEACDFREGVSVKRGRGRPKVVATAE